MCYSLKRSKKQILVTTKPAIEQLSKRLSIIPAADVFKRKAIQMQIDRLKADVNRVKEAA